MLYTLPMAKIEFIQDALTTSEALRFTNGHFVKSDDEVCREVVVNLHLNDRLLTKLVASPMQYRELGAGFVISEGLTEQIDDVKVEGNTIYVYAQQAAESDSYITESSGGSSSGMIRKTIDSGITIDQQGIFKVIDEIVSELWEKTGGAHCSVLLSHGKLITKSSDVGRHNTVDKVIGYGVLNRIDLSTCVLGCTGRQPVGMVSKAINAGIPIIVTKAATTYEGIALAQKAGLTLICRVKGDKFCVYTHPHRVRDLDA